MKIIAATNNKHKVVEIKAILAPIGIEVLSAAEVGGMPDVVEDADSFEGNAAKKAVECALSLKLPVLSDDSGLCVDALDGRPGIYSARYGGPGLDDKDRCNLLLKELENCEDRNAHFACVVALANADGKILGTAMGKCEGRIDTEMNGNGGFGYDPLFIPDGYKESFAELGEDVKNSLSHRKNALENALKDQLFKLLEK